ncbi:MAG: class I SAM-dependent methyltransferase [Candidatus Dormibacteraceae bacterium]
MIDPPQAGVVLEPTRCAICGTLDNADELYGPTFDAASFNQSVFSARRLPDRVHYRMVRCRTCGLVRSDPAAGDATLSNLYGLSGFDYASEIPNLRTTYRRYLARARGYAAGESLLEVGCGNGFMLQEALNQGYRSVRGVEPSRRAVAAAESSVRDCITTDMMSATLFGAGEFDTACLFQVLDHLPDPGGMLDQLHRVLKPGGILLCFNHNIRSASALLLGERSPIVDIEHCYLYSSRTMTTLFEQHRFDVLECRAATNTVSLRHLLHLLPAPSGVKKGALQAVSGSRVGRLALGLRLGNLYAIARKR